MKTSNKAKPYITLSLIGLIVLTGTGGISAREYVIGAADVLYISVLDHKELDSVVTVSPDGKITFPLIGDIRASGLTAAELAGKITKELEKTVKNPSVTVALREINSYRIYFLGKLNKPGVHYNKSEITLLQALSLAGGTTEGADLSLAYVVRGEEKLSLDFIKLLRGGDIGQNILLMPEDTIVIPDNPKNVVYVMGEVKQPGVYYLSKERELSVLKAIALAGGFTNYAAPSRVTVIREGSEKKFTIRVDVNDLIKSPETSKDIILHPGDTIIVPQSFF